jgi:DNA polymerase/3'-5' exonuclease PolX
MPKRPGYWVMTLSEATKVYNHIKKKIHVPAYVAGSIRRKKQDGISDIDIVLVPGQRDITDMVYNIFTRVEKFGKQIINGTVEYHGHKILVDLFITTRSELPFAMLQYTGPKFYNIRIRRYVRDQRGWLLNQHGLFYANNTSKKVVGSNKLRTEKDIIRFIGTTYYSPSDRM